MSAYLSSVLWTFGEFLEAIYWFFCAFSIIGLWSLRKWIKQPAGRFFCVFLVISLVWRIHYNATYDMVSQRYLLAATIPWLILVVPGVIWGARLMAWIVSWFGWKRFPVRGFIALTILVLAVGNIIKICRFPKYKVYLAEIAGQLTPYADQGLLIDGTGEYGRLYNDFGLNMPGAIITKSVFDKLGCGDAWKATIDRNRTRADSIFLLADTELPATETDIDWGGLPVELLGIWDYRYKRVSLWHLGQDLNPDWAIRERSAHDPDPLNFSLPEQIELHEGDLLELKWASLTGVANWNDYIFTVSKPYGHLYSDAFRYRMQEGDPDQFELTVTIADAMGFTVAERSVTVVNTQAPSSTLPPAERVPAANPPDYSDYFPPLSIPETIFISAEHGELRCNGMILAPDPERYAWSISGVEVQQALSDGPGWVLRLPPKPGTALLEISEKNGPQQRNIPVNVVPLSGGKSPHSILFLDDGLYSFGNKWAQLLPDTELLYHSCADWNALDSSVDTLDIPVSPDWIIINLHQNEFRGNNALTIRKNYDALAAAVDASVEGLRLRWPESRIAVSLLPPYPESQDAYISLNAGNPGFLYTDWDSRTSRHIINRLLGECLANRESEGIYLLPHVNIGAPGDYPSVPDPLLDRNLTGHDVRLSPEGREKFQLNIIDIVHGFSE